MLIKSNRIALQTYKVEERTFGTPCIFINVMMSEELENFVMLKVCLGPVS